MDFFVTEALGLIAALMVLIITAAIVTGTIFYFIDRHQSNSSIRRNYPLIGRFRYLFEHLGEFFRQYFFAMDREEQPFNRALRSWVYRAAKGLSTNVAFGSTRNNTQVGEPHFLNSPFPVLDEEKQTQTSILFGPYCEKPYEAHSFFNISGMSYGALSKPAIIALSRGAARAGCWLNTGEGGLSPHHLAANADIVFQIGTAKYGVRDNNGALSEKRLKDLAANPQVKMFEIKLSQGAKPGKGGILPAEKVSAEIAAIRGIPEGQSSISPNRHPEVNTNEDLLDLVKTVKNATGKPVGIKFVMGNPDWVSDLCHTIKTRPIEDAPDFISLDSAEGGTGAAPQALMDYVGLPLRESLGILVDTLHSYELRDRIRIVASGKLITPAFVGLALATGADVVVSARGFMFALGCIQAMQCHKNTCPTGVTTHDPKLQHGLDPANKANRVANYHHQVVHEVGIIAHSCGVSEPAKLRREHVRIVMEDGRSKALQDCLQGEPVKIIGASPQ